MLGALYATTLFFSIINATVIQPVISAERAVSYRERAAGMYSVLPFTLALVSIVLALSSEQPTLLYILCTPLQSYLLGDVVKLSNSEPLLIILATHCIHVLKLINACIPAQSCLLGGVVKLPSMELLS